MNSNQDYKLQLASYATEYILEKYGIWERYNKERDIHHHGNPCPQSQNEPLYAISEVWDGILIKNTVYSKKEKGFIFLSSPSNRTDKEIQETSFTLHEAYYLVRILNQGAKLK